MGRGERRFADKHRRDQFMYVMYHFRKILLGKTSGSVAQVLRAVMILISII